MGQTSRHLFLHVEKKIMQSPKFSFLSDPEEGNVIGNSHHKPPGGTEISEPKSPTNDEMVSLGEGEQSVLQAKLTNMAIQVSASSSIDIS